MSTEIADLRAYLEEDRTRQVTEGTKLDKVIEGVNKLGSEHQLMRLSFESKFEMVHHQIAGIHSRVSGLERQQDLTGSSNVEALHAQLKMERDAKHDLHKTILSAIGGALVLGLGAAGSIIWYLVLHGK